MLAADLEPFGGLIEGVDLLAVDGHSKRGIPHEIAGEAHAGAVVGEQERAGTGQPLGHEKSVNIGTQRPFILRGAIGPREARDRYSLPLTQAEMDRRTDDAVL